MPKTPQIHALTKTAKSLGYETKTYTKGGAFSKIVKITDPRTKKICLLAPKETGFYPDTLRWFKVVANSKILSEQVLRDLGYKTITSTFFADPSETMSSLKARCQKLKRFPYLIKPEEGNKGKGIKIVSTTAELVAYATALYQEDRQFMVQPLEYGTEYRVLVINKKVRVAHTKEFPVVLGDGIKTVSALLQDAAYTVDYHFVDAFLQTQQMDRSSVPEKGMRIPIHITRKGSTQYYSNFSTTARPVPAHIQRWGTKLAKDLGTKTLGVDVFIPDEPKAVSESKIIEINASPGFVYLQDRYKDKQTVTKICEEVLTSYFA